MNTVMPRGSRGEMLSTVVDLASLLVAGVVVVTMAFDVRYPGRPVVALLFITWVPGWSFVRIAAVPVTTLTAVGAFVFSLSIMILTSFVLATRLDWAWRLTAVLWATLCASLLAVVLRRRSGDAVSAS